MATVVCESGVGKTRLLYELRLAGADTPANPLFLRGRAGPELQNVPYALLRDLFAAAF